MFWYLLGVLINGLIFGFATAKVIENKGYDDNWFWWGFFFGLIALIVACAKPENPSLYESVSSSPYSNAHPSNPFYNPAPRTPVNGEWQCKCGRINAPYVSSCSCGKNKHDVLSVLNKQKQEEEKLQAEVKTQAVTKPQIADMDEKSKASAIREYKALMDDGIISPEEFEAKKKQLLGL